MIFVRLTEEMKPAALYDFTSMRPGENPLVSFDDGRTWRQLTDEEARAPLHGTIRMVNVTNGKRNIQTYQRVRRA